MAPNQSRNTRCDSLSELFLKACKNGELAKVNAAIVLEVDVNFKNENWLQNGLILAIRGKHEAVVDLLLSQPDIDINAKSGRTFPLALAASLGLTSIVAKLGQMATLQGVNDRACDESDDLTHRRPSDPWKGLIGFGLLATPISLATKRGESAGFSEKRHFTANHRHKIGITPFKCTFNRF